MADPVSATIVTTAKVGIAVAKASANPIRRRKQAHDRRMALERLLRNSLARVLGYDRLVAPANRFVDRLPPGLNTDIVDRIMVTADGDIARGNGYRQGWNRLTGSDNPPDLLARLDYGEVIARIEKWTLNALLDAWQAQHEDREPDERQLSKLARLVATEFFRSLDEARRTGDKIAQSLVVQISDASDTADKATRLKVMAATLATGGAAALGSTALIANDAGLTTSDSAAVITSAVVLTAATNLAARANSRMRAGPQAQPASASNAVQIVIPWLVDLAVAVLTVRGRSRVEFVQLATALGLDADLLPEKPDQSGDGLLAESIFKLRERLDRRVMPAADQIGDGTLTMQLMVLGDHADRIGDRSPTVDLEGLASAICETLNWLCVAPVEVPAPTQGSLADSIRQSQAKRRHDQTVAGLRIKAPLPRSPDRGDGST